MQPTEVSDPSHDNEESFDQFDFQDDEELYSLAESFDISNAFTGGSFGLTVPANHTSSHTDIGRSDTVETIAIPGSTAGFLELPIEEIGA